jgi:hypothetical protein
LSDEVKQGVLFDESTGDITYVGELKNELKDGFGTEYDPFTDQPIYEGRWRANYKHGYG